MLFGIYVVALVTAVLLMCVTNSESVQVPVPVPVRAISERGTLWVMLVMGKAGHRLQQGRTTMTESSRVSRVPETEMTESSRVPRVPKAEMTESSRVPRVLKAEMTESSRVSRVLKAEVTESSRVRRLLEAEMTGTRRYWYSDDLCKTVVRIVGREPQHPVILKRDFQVFGKQDTN